MASVAVTFLLIAAIFIVKSAEASRKELEANRKAMVPLDKVKQAQEDSRIALDRLFGILKHDESISAVAQVIRDDADPFLLTIIYRSDRLTFATDRSDLNSAARTVIDTSFPVVIRGVCAEERKIESVVLEGHTDAQGGEEKFQYNVELSSRRALTVFGEGRKVVEQSKDLLHCIDSKFTVAGRGPVQPLDRTIRWDDWEMRRGSKPEDRRVEVKVRFSAGEDVIRDLKREL
jgi:outer membrane protein OmpA-like peptidoglycan-associated protein